ncbi:hypothetical protein ACLOJK_039100 [Asimina triloba]
MDSHSPPEHRFGAPSPTLGTSAMAAVRRGFPSRRLRTASWATTWQIRLTTATQPPPRQQIRWRRRPRADARAVFSKNGVHEQATTLSTHPAAPASTASDQRLRQQAPIRSTMVSFQKSNEQRSLRGWRGGMAAVAGLFSSTAFPLLLRRQASKGRGCWRNLVHDLENQRAVMSGWAWAATVMIVGDRPPHLHGGRTSADEGEGSNK